MWRSGKGKRPGRKAFSARRRRQMESFPPEKSRAGLEHCPATSRRMWIASASSQSRCDSGRFERVVATADDMLSVVRYNGCVVKPPPAATPSQELAQVRGGAGGLHVEAALRGHLEGRPRGVGAPGRVA